MLSMIPLHLRYILRPLRTVGVMLILTLDLHPIRIRHILILIAGMISRSPGNKLVPIPTLPSLERFIALAEGFRREFEPGRVVCVAIDVLQEAVETVLYVVIEVVFLRRASVGCGRESLDLDLRWVIKVYRTVVWVDE